MNQQERIAAMASLLVEARRAHKDVGEIVAVSLHVAAQKLGQVDDLIRGRSGSWEADIVQRMAMAGEYAALSQARLNEESVQKLSPLFVEMGRAREDGGDILSQAMSQAVDTLGGLEEFAGGSRWYWDLTNMGRQYSTHWDDPWPGLATKREKGQGAYGEAEYESQDILHTEALEKSQDLDTDFDR